jgi:hypothetical protein
MSEEKEVKKEVKVCKNIHEAINEVYNRVGYVQKKGKISMGKSGSYTVATEAEFIAAIRPELSDIGIYQHPLNVAVVSNERIESDKIWDGVVTKTYQHRVVIHSIYRFTHVSSGTFVDVESFGEGMDTGDKSFNKAMTGANKYAIRQLFMIETGDDPDKYASDENGGVKGAIVTNEQAVEIDILMRKVGADKAKFLEVMKSNSVETIPAASYTKAMELLKRKEAQNGKSTTA